MSCALEHSLEKSPTPSPPTHTTFTVSQLDAQLCAMLRRSCIACADVQMHPRRSGAQPSPLKRQHLYNHTNAAAPLRRAAVTFEAAAVVPAQGLPPRRLIVDVGAVGAQRPAAAVPHERQHIGVLFDIWA
jgi:hypothetical protein